MKITISLTAIILCFWIAAAVTFALCWLTRKLDICDSCGDPILYPAVICSLVWPVAAPIYAAYLAAVWYASLKE